MRQQTNAHAASRQVRTGGRVLGIALALVLAVVAAALGWWLGRGSVHPSLAEYRQITFRTGSIDNARFAPDGSIIYGATWEAATASCISRARMSRERANWV